MNFFRLATVTLLVVLAMMHFCCFLDGKNRRQRGTDLESALFPMAFNFLTPSEFLCHLDHWHVFVLFGLCYGMGLCTDHQTTVDFG